MNDRKMPHPLEMMACTDVHISQIEEAVPAQVIDVRMHIDSQYREYLLLYIKQLPNQAHLRRPRRKFGWDTPQADAVARVNAESHTERARLLKLVGHYNGRKSSTTSMLPLVDTTIGVVQDSASGRVNSICPIPQPVNK